MTAKGKFEMLKWKTHKKKHLMLFECRKQKISILIIIIIRNSESRIENKVIEPTKNER